MGSAKGKKELACVYLKASAYTYPRNFVILPKSVTPARIEENKDIYDFELSEEDMQSLNTGKYESCSWDPTISRD